MYMKNVLHVFNKMHYYILVNFPKFWKKIQNSGKSWVPRSQALFCKKTFVFKAKLLFFPTLQVGVVRV